MRRIFIAISTRRCGPLIREPLAEGEVAALSTRRSRRCSKQVLWPDHLRRTRVVSIEFLITSLIVVASPGTGVLVTLAAGLSRGARAAVVAAFGCTLGIVPHMLAAVTGLAALLHTSAVAFQLIKYTGVAYLLYMAWMTLNEHGALKVEADEAPRSDGQVIVSAV